jgi:NadR type nicotinamide-nucleotide adenylyltransferase
VSEGRVPRVVVTGSESTGKTWLAERLAVRFATVWSREFSREYALRKGAPLDASDVEPIARGQITLEDAVLARARGLAIHDTDLVSTVVYARHYYGHCPAWIEATARARLGALYLLCDVDVPWVADPARDRPHARGQLHAAFAAQLETFDARVTLIRGLWEQREADAIVAVERLLAS